MMMPSWLSMCRTFVHDSIKIKHAPGQNKEAFWWVLPLAVGLLGAAYIYGPVHAVSGAIAARISGAGRSQPIRRRLRIAAGAFVVSQFFLMMGMLAARNVYVEFITIILLTSIGIWVWFALAVGVPGRINMCFATAFGVYLGIEHHDMWQVLQINILVWVLCMLTAIIIMIPHLHRVETSAVEKAEKAVDTYVELADKENPALKEEVDDARLKAYVQLNEAWAVLRTGRSDKVEKISGYAAKLEERINIAYFKIINRLEKRYYPHTPMHMKEYTHLHSLGRPGPLYLLNNARRYGSRPRMIATRTAFSLVIAFCASHFFNVGHSYWAILSALIVLHQGASRFDSVVRGVHRVVGTSIGLACYVVLLMYVDNLWLRLFIVICCIYGLESFNARNYGIAVVFITLYALLLVPVGAEVTLGQIIHDRFIETIIGISSALIGVWVINDPKALVYRHFYNTLDAVVHVLDTMSTESFVSYDAIEKRRNLLFELACVAEMLQRAMQDEPKHLEPWVEVEREVFRIVGVVLSANWRMMSRDPDVVAHTQNSAQWAAGELRAILAAFPLRMKSDIDAYSLAQRINQTRMEFTFRTF